MKENYILKSAFSLLLFLTISVAYPQLEPELIYYKFDGSGTNVPNTAQTPVGTNPAPLVAHTQGGSGQFGGALLGGGTSGYLNTGWNSTLTGDWTLSFWIDFGSAAATFQYFFGDGGAQSWRMFANGAAGVGNVVMAKTGFTNTVAFGVADGNPHVVHYVWETSAGNLKAYVDGVLSNTISQTSGAVSGGNGLRIGGYTSGSMVAGVKMDEVRLYNRALTPQEISDTWNNELPLFTGPNDAGISQIISPVDTCTGTRDVKVEVVNYGTNKINQVQINWSINGVLQSPLAYSSILDTANGLGPNKDTVFLGTANVPALSFTDIASWTTMPNGVVDTATRNDSADVSTFGFPFPSINLGIDTSICPGEPISLDGGIRDSLRWQNNTNNQMFNVSNAGQYSIRVYENGCESRDTINVTLFPAAPTVNFGADTILCFGETLLLDATTPGVTYTWQDNSTGPTFTVDTIGKYTVILEDANTCNSEEEIRVDYYTEPSVLLIVSPRNEICNQTPYLFRAFPTTQGSVAFQWRVNGVATGAVTTDATFAGPINYGDSVSVDLITDVCSTSVYPVPSDKIEMILNPAPKSINGKTTVIENTSGVYLVPLTPTSSYVWRVSGGTIVGDSTNNNVNIKWGGANPNATLTLVETDQSNCVRENLIDVDVVSIIGFNELENNLELGEAYPNPSSNIVTIPVLTTSNMMIDMSLIDISGKLVTPIYNGMITGDKQIKLDVTEIKSGLYFYKIITSDGYQTVRKLTVQH